MFFESKSLCGFPAYIYNSFFILSYLKLKLAELINPFFFNVNIGENKSFEYVLAKPKIPSVPSTSKLELFAEPK